MMRKFHTYVVLHVEDSPAAECSHWHEVVGKIWLHLRLFISCVAVDRSLVTIDGQKRAIVSNQHGEGIHYTALQLFPRTHTITCASVACNTYPTSTSQACATFSHQTLFQQLNFHALNCCCQPGQWKYLNMNFFLMTLNADRTSSG